MATAGPIMPRVATIVRPAIFRAAIFRTAGRTVIIVAFIVKSLAFEDVAEICGRYLAKGRKVCVVGELQNRSYDAKDGTKRYVTEIVAEDVEFLTPRGERDASGAGDYAPRNDRPAPQAPDGFVDIDDDALPF